MILALLTVTAAQLLDLATFVRMVAGHGALAEANPLVRSILVEHGVPVLAVAKIAVLALVVAVIATLAGRTGVVEHRRTVGVLVALAIVAGVIGGWSNAAVIL
jgi:hypothetical protein